jgi:EAL domain-containing protein (putative c-di-GMP-specific phosphodiesterase class I)
MHPNTRDLFIDAIITIAHDQHLHVVAEGVETMLRRDTLIELYCAVIHGFLARRLLPATEFHGWPKRHYATQGVSSV